MPARSLLTALALVAALAAMRAGASGVLQKLTLADAVSRAREVLIVETVKPPERIVTRLQPYVDRKTKQKKTLTLRRTLYRFKLVRRLGTGGTGPKPGTVLEVVSSNAVVGEMVQVAMVTTGTWPVPYLPQLEGQAAPKEGGRYVLLVGGYDAKEKHHLGVGGLGLLPIEREAEVVRLLQKRTTK